MQAPHAQIDVPMDAIRCFCQRWRIRELSLFGSVLRDDFHADSDVDVLVRFEQGEQWSLLDLVAMREQLQSIFGRPVDLVEERCLRNPFRRRGILRTKEPIYAA
jgi:hypothetical protein